MNAKAAGLIVGAYHYSQAISVSEAKAEAEYICNILKDYTPTFYVVCDYEFGKRLNKNIGTKASEIANAFCDVVKAHGYKPCIYANTNTLNNYLKNPKHPVWVAQYASSCTYKGSKVMWQYTSSGKVDGISGNVDLSHVYEVSPQPVTTTPTVTTNAQKLVDKMKDLAWAYGTAKSKYDYDTGAPTSACKNAMNKYGYNTKAKWSDCGDFVTTVVREAGVDKNFKALYGVKTAFHTKEDKFNIVFKGKAIPDGTLKAGDIIRYKKTSGQHAMFYFGDGKICDAGHYDRFGNIRNNDHRYNGSNVKKDTIQVLRAKE